MRHGVGMYVLLLAHRGALLAGGLVSIGWKRRRILEIHADRKRPDEREMAALVDGEPFPLDARLQRTIDGIQEVVAMRLNVKADEIRAQQSFQQFALPRTDPEPFRIRPGDVPEDGHARVRTLLFDQARDQREV